MHTQIHDTTLCVTPISSWASRNRALNLVTHFVSGEYPGTSGSGKPAAQTREDNVAELLKFSFRIASHLEGWDFPVRRNTGSWRQMR